MSGGSCIAMTAVLLRVHPWHRKHNDQCLMRAKVMRAAVEVRMQMTRARDWRRQKQQ